MSGLTTSLPNIKYKQHLRRYNTESNFANLQKSLLLKFQKISNVFAS
jgi:hypothetical protein